MGGVQGQIDFVSLRASGSESVPYALAWTFQKELLERRVRDEVPDTFLFVEHPPTITRGRGLQKKPDERDEERERDSSRAVPLAAIPAGTEYFEIERGGDLTWHGPGQLVVYPIIKLDGAGFGPDHDVAAYLRKLESVFGRWLGRYGLRTEAREHATGIWVIPQGGGPKKIASIGIAVRKWVSYHGIGLNLANELSAYRAISPCGFDPSVMTTLAAESSSFVKRGWTPAVRAEVEREIAGEIRLGAEVFKIELVD